jgi:flagellin-like protein
MKNKGISPLVATVILIAISVSLALIINAWLVNYVNERLKEIETSYTSSMECIKSSFRVLEYLIEEREI